MRVDLDALEGIPAEPEAVGRVVDDPHRDERVLAEPRVAQDDDEAEEPEEGLEAAVERGIRRRAWGAGRARS
jgi:hypothetical protein